ncbi:hypothetical protein ACFFRR_003040 [Megaselia abdita]
MILPDSNGEINIDESITDRSPAIYFITHLYCNEAIRFPDNWDQLSNSYVYTTEYIARLLYAYLGTKDKFRILDSVKPMTIVLSSGKHFKVTTFTGRGVNKNCALLLEIDQKFYFYNGLFKSYQHLEGKITDKINCLIIDTTLNNKYEPLNVNKLNDQISTVIESGIKNINVHIPLFGFEELIENLIKKYGQYVTYDENFSRILKLSTLARIPICLQPDGNIRIYVTNAVYNRSCIEPNSRTIIVVEGDTISSFLENVDIVSWSVLPIHDEIQYLMRIVKPLRMMSTHGDYFNNCSLSQSFLSDSFDLLSISKCQNDQVNNNDAIRPSVEILQDDKATSYTPIANFLKKFHPNYIYPAPKPQPSTLIKDLLNKYYPGYVDSILAESAMSSTTKLQKEVGIINSDSSKKYRENSSTSTTKLQKKVGIINSDSSNEKSSTMNPQKEEEVGIISSDSSNKDREKHSTSTTNPQKEAGIINSDSSNNDGEKSSTSTMNPQKEEEVGIISSDSSNKDREKHSTSTTKPQKEAGIINSDSSNNGREKSSTKNLHKKSNTAMQEKEVSNTNSQKEGRPKKLIDLTNKFSSSERARRHFVFDDFDDLSE